MSEVVTLFIACGTGLLFYFPGKIMVKRSWKRGVKRMKESMDWEECWHSYYIHQLRDRITICMRPAQNLARERSSLLFKFMAHGRLSMPAVWSLIHGHVDNVDWTLILSIFLKKI